MGQIIEGVQVGFKGLDLAADYGLGVAGVWELEESEAAVLARIILRRADKGDKKALKTISAIQENMDLLQAATIIIPRVGATIKEVGKNGAKPHIKKRAANSVPISGGENNP